MVKLTDFRFANDETKDGDFIETDIEQYQHDWVTVICEQYQHDWVTVICEWDGETRTLHGFHEADHMYTGNGVDECAKALNLSPDEMNGLLGSDVTYLERNSAQ